jgi:hypothetical protein
LVGYEDVNDAERLRHDPAVRWIVGGKAAQGRAASPSQMGRFETQWLTAEKNQSALADLSGPWIDIVHGRRPPKGIVLDMDFSKRGNKYLRKLLIHGARAALPTLPESSDPVGRMAARPDDENAQKRRCSRAGRQARPSRPRPERTSATPRPEGPDGQSAPLCATQTDAAV